MTDEQNTNEEKLNEQSLNEIKALWQNQALTEEIEMDIILKRSREFTNKINFRNSLEWAALAAVLPLFTYRLIKADTAFSTLMYLEMIFAGAFVGLHLYFRARPAPPPDRSAPVVDFLKHEKEQLENQKNLLARARYWYVIPLLIGPIGLALENAWQKSSGGLEAMAPHLAYVFGVIVLGMWVVWHNEVKGVKQVDAQIRNLGLDEKSR